MVCILVGSIISGGQTGVDRAAFDVAIELGVPHRGWVPKGKVAEDGPISDRYNVFETPSQEPSERTSWNVRDSDATLIISREALKDVSPGSELTDRLASQSAKPCLHINLRVLSIPEAAIQITRWLTNVASAHCVRRIALNVAGPRHSEDPEIYELARLLLREVLVPQDSGAVGEEGVALRIYDQSLSNFRHWDQIRWLTPLWIVTLAAALTTWVSQELPTAHPATGVLFLLFGVFSFLCFYLLCRLIIYHNEHFEALATHLMHLLPASPARAALMQPLPFSFDKKGFRAGPGNLDRTLSGVSA
ncbi:MAG: putative molybdenum carrier protein [Xanthobacteraceae bacterium]